MTSWRERAYCLTEGHPRDAFFADEELSGYDGVEHYRAAREICACCPVIEQCLEYALRTNQESGVWGGLSPDERKRLRRKL